jgi:predicted O-linked N-acetylglucosamine transferase (SPINDLY family)
LPPPLLLLPRMAKQQHLARLRQCKLLADTWPYVICPSRREKM